MNRIACLTICVVVYVGSVRPAAAYDDEVHYALTYYVARVTGYTPQQADRIANACVGVDYAYDTEPVQTHGARFAGNLTFSPRGALDLLDSGPGLLARDPKEIGFLDALNPEKTANLVESPASLYNQGPRLKFHGFIREPGGESGKPWYLMTNEEREAFQADEQLNIAAQTVLLWNDGIKHRNPGVFLHFFQDLVPHAGYGAKYGHYDVFVYKQNRIAADLPQGPITDWMSYRSHSDDPARCINDTELHRLEANTQLFNATAARLRAFMKSASDRQVPLSPQVDEQLILRLVQANCPAKGLLKQVYDLYDYKRDDTRFRPNLGATRMVLQRWMERAGMQEGQLPPPKLPLPYEIRADRKYYFAGLRNQEEDFYEPDPNLGWQEEPGAESDKWVLWGDVNVHLTFPPDYTERHTFEVVALLPSTQSGQQEYELISLYEPWEKRVGPGDPPVVLHKLPIGDVIIELRRLDGFKTRSRHAVDRRQNDVRVDVRWEDERILAFEPTDHTLIDPRFDGNRSSFAGSDFEVETDPSRMTGAVSKIWLKVRFDLFSKDDADELRLFREFVDGMRPRDQAAVQVNDRRDIGDREILFVQRWLSSNAPNTTSVTGFYSHPDRGTFMCIINGAQGVGHDELIAEWNRLKPKVNALLDLRVAGANP